MTTRDLEDMNDVELADRARKVHEKLMTLPRNHESRDGYILSWRLVIDEMNRRRLPPYPPQNDPLTTRRPGNSGFAPGNGVHG